MLSAAIVQAVSGDQAVDELVVDQAGEQRDHHPGGREVDRDAEQVAVGRVSVIRRSGSRNDGDHDGKQMVPRLLVIAAHHRAQ